LADVGITQPALIWSRYQHADIGQQMEFHRNTLYFKIPGYIEPFSFVYRSFGQTTLALILLAISSMAIVIKFADKVSGGSFYTLSTCSSLQTGRCQPLLTSFNIFITDPPSYKDLRKLTRTRRNSLWLELYLQMCILGAFILYSGYKSTMKAALVVNEKEKPIDDYQVKFLVVLTYFMLVSKRMFWTWT